MQRKSSFLRDVLFLSCAGSLLFIDQLVPSETAVAISNGIRTVSNGEVDQFGQVIPIPDFDTDYHERNEKGRERERGKEGEESEDDDTADQEELREGKPATEIRTERNKEIDKENDEIDEENESLPEDEQRPDSDKEDPKPKGYPKAPSTQPAASSLAEELFRLADESGVSPEELLLELSDQVLPSK